MFFEFVATVTAGFAGAGVTLALARLTGGRVPGRAAPVIAGAAMIVFLIWSEYSWYARTAAALPPGVEVAQTIENSGMLRPWTLVWPYVHRFVAVDTGRARTNPDLPGQRMADLYFFGRWAPVNRVTVLFDCPGGRSAEMVEGVDFAADGQVTGVTWRPMAASDPVFATACAPLTG